MNECQFDCETVKAYLQEEQKISALGAEPDDNFQNYIRMKNRTQLEDKYKTLFDELIDNNKISEQEQQLHPGFEKVCGLKGSKLSGGQK